MSLPAEKKHKRAASQPRFRTTRKGGGTKIESKTYLYFNRGIEREW